MIRVVDAIMGSGKTEAAISYMRENPEKKFIYISPYISEDSRIRTACPQLRFVEPEERYYRKDEEDDEYWRTYEVAKRTKVMHTSQLIEQGENIATTHQAFMYYTKDMLQQIRDQHYTLIIDEDLQAVSMLKMEDKDLSFIEDKLVKNDDGVYRLIDEDYNHGLYYGFARLLMSRELVRVTGDDENGTAVFWSLPPDLIRSFDDVFVLTYLFEGQALYNLLAMNQMPYERIGIRFDKTGYHFDENGSYVPEYTRHLSEVLHIVEDRDMNSIGEKWNALSVSWMKSQREKRDQLQKYIYSFFNYRTRGQSTSKNRLWTTFKNHKKHLSGEGYTRNFLVLNKKASNEYARATHLVYAANIFMHPAFKNFYRKYGLDANEDLYALSTMVQWIWRSAIRNGGEIWVYIPSKRMRDMFKAWIYDVTQMGIASMSNETGGAA